MRMALSLLLAIKETSLPCQLITDVLFYLNLFFTHLSTVSSEELVFPGLCVFPCPCYNGHSLLLISLSILNQQYRESFSVCGHSTKDIYLILHCSVEDFAPLAFEQFLFDVRPLVQAFGAPWSSTMPHSSKGVR